MSDFNRMGASRARVVQFAALALAVLGAAACTHNGVDLAPIMSISVASGKDAPTLPFKSAPSCFKFSSDDTAGQLSQTRTITISNGSSDGSILCVKTPIFTAGANKLYKMEMGKAVAPASGQCLDKAAGAAVPGVFTALAQNQSFTITVTYTGSPGLSDTAKLALISNGTSGDPFAYTSTDLCFGIGTIGPRLTLDAQELIFHNATPSSPQEQCIGAGNAGDEPLCFDSAYFAQPNSQYAVSKQPSKGDCIPARGDAKNPVVSPMEWKICVRYTPDSTVGNEQLQLNLKTNDANAKIATIALDAVTDLLGNYKVTCKNSSGALMYDFIGMTSGVKEATCTVTNLGPASFSLNAFAEIAAVGPFPQEGNISSIYALTELTVGGSALTGPVFAFKAGNSLDFIVKLTYPGDGSLPPQAQLIITFSQMPKGADKLYLPIAVGSGNWPALSYGPSSLWQQAAVGASATASVILANQSPAPLQLLDACILPQTAVVDPAKDPCGANAASKYTTITPAFALKTLAPWQLYPLEIVFAPTDDKQMTRTELLHITWCMTQWDGSKCMPSANGGSGLRVQSIGLGGNAEKMALPALMLPADNPAYTHAVAGQPLTITGQFDTGTGYPACQNFAWTLKSRPAGSMAWKTPSEQNTADANYTFVPDIPGDYTILAMGQACNAPDQTKLAWSKQVELTVKVGAAVP